MQKILGSTDLQIATMRVVQRGQISSNLFSNVVFLRNDSTRLSNDTPLFENTSRFFIGEQNGIISRNHVQAWKYHG